MLILTKESIIVVKMFNKNILRTLSALALISPIGIVGVNILGVNIGANETISIFGNGIDVAVSDQSLDLIPNLIYLGIASIVLSLLTTSATDYFFAEIANVFSPVYIRFIFSAGLSCSATTITIGFCPNEAEYSYVLCTSLSIITALSYFCVKGCIRDQNQLR